MFTEQLIASKANHRNGGNIDFLTCRFDLGSQDIARSGMGERKDEFIHESILTYSSRDW
jgi:hypothetical protein